MLQHINTNLTVGGGSRGYGLGSTPNGFSLLTGLIGLEKTTNGPWRVVEYSPRQIMHQQVAPSVGHTTTSFVLSHHRKATIELKSR